MTLLSRFLYLFAFGGIVTAMPDTALAGSLFDLAAKDIDGREVSLSTYKGQVVLVVNTASKCGFTSQYEGLEKLYDTYKDRGFTVLGFPSNDFMGQEPGSNEDIKSFCQLNYDVSFPLFSKAPVSGAQKQEVFRFLTEMSAEDLRGEVRWNFEKFLVDREGKVVARWRSTTGPSNSRIVAMIEQLLSGRAKD